MNMTVTATPQCEFDPAAHVYTINGRRVPSVTQVLGAAGMTNGAYWTPESRDRGTYVARATEILDRDPDDFDWDAVDDDKVGYVCAWEKFKCESGCEIVASEAQVYSEAYQFAGTLDRIIKDCGPVLIDIKTGTFAEWHRLQTAGYRLCRDERPLGRAAVYLNSDGSYRCVEHLDRRDEDVFKAALAVANWRAQHIPGVSFDGNDDSGNDHYTP
jgi:hypothetical protein